MDMSVGDGSDGSLEPPLDFKFVPAHGKLLENGNVMVSGMQFQQLHIHRTGQSYKNLADILLEIAGDQVPSRKQDAEQ